MAHSRYKAKGRRESGRFVALPATVLDSPQYALLPAQAVKLLVDLLAQYNGSNNGDLCATWSLMKRRGWRSRDTLDRALNDLLGSRFVVKTRQGQKGYLGGQRIPTLYAVTWKGIDDCGGKLDVKPNPVPLNTWKQNNSIARLPCHTDTAPVLKVAGTG